MFKRIGRWWPAGLMLLVSVASAQPVPIAVETLTLELASEDQQVDIYRGGSAAPIGVAVVVHGFNRSRSRHRDLGRALGEAGIVSMQPFVRSMPFLVYRAHVKR